MHIVEAADAPYDRMASMEWEGITGRVKQLLELQDRRAESNRELQDRRADRMESKLEAVDSKLEAMDRKLDDFINTVTTAQ